MNNWLKVRKLNATQTCSTKKTVPKLAMGICLLLMSFHSLNSLGQNLETPKGVRIFKEFKKSVFAKKKEISAETSLEEVLTIYTDMGKIYLAEKYITYFRVLKKAANSPRFIEETARPSSRLPFSDHQ